MYSFLIRIYWTGIYLASFFSSKSKLWIEGRKKWKEKLKDAVLKFERRPIWFHVSSLGEFEQARSLIEKIKSENPNEKIVLSFFSPSGYEIRKNYPFADYVCYLPLDTKSHAKFFTETLNPKIGIFTKYDLWLNMIRESAKKEIPLFVISAVYTEKTFQNFFFRKYTEEGLKNIQTGFVQNDASKKILEETFGYHSVIIAPDTRIDRVIQIKENRKELSVIRDFVNPVSFIDGVKDSFIVVFGSTHRKDEILIQSLILHCRKNNFLVKCIIAPHEASEENCKRLKNFLSDSSLYSNPNHNSSILIIDNIGLLSSIYQYANVAYVGGGFDRGIHNTLEPAVYNLPIIFGPNYEKFSEAVEFVNIKCAFTINNSAELIEKFILLYKNENIRKQIADTMKGFFVKNAGGTEIIYSHLKKFL